MAFDINSDIRVAKKVHFSDKYGVETGLFVRSIECGFVAVFILVQGFGGGT